LLLLLLLATVAIAAAVAVINAAIVAATDVNTIATATGAAAAIASAAVVPASSTAAFSFKLIVLFYHRRCSGHIKQYPFPYGSKQCQRQSNAPSPLLLLISVYQNFDFTRNGALKTHPAKMSTMGFYSNSLMLCKLVISLTVCRYSGLYLKRRLHTNFNSYVVGMEPETKDLHSELSLEICSRARHTVKSPKKEQDDGLQAN
jgi:hypothetical protein